MAEKIMSQESGVAPYETFFHDFEFEAFSFFNYWTPDETTNDGLSLENRDVNDMPRFVKLVWNRAPDLQEQKDAYQKTHPPTLGRIDVIKKPGQFIVDGILYSPEQILPSDFSRVSTALANSDIAPGVITSVVSLPLAPSGWVPLAPVFRLDLDTWYSNTKSQGVSINDLRNTYNNRSSEIFNLSKVYAEGVSLKNQEAFDEMFSGQFAVAPSSFVNRTMSVRTANPKSPALSLRAASAKSLRPGPTSPSEDIFNEISYDHHPPTVNSVNVSFVDTGIGSVVSNQRLNVAVDAAHVNSMSAVAQVLKNLVSYSESGLQNSRRKITLKSFECPNGVASKEYVGYLIEKYEQINGVFVMKELIGIGDANIDEYYDTHVRYGGVYRYRIRSVMRWVRPKNVGPEGVDKTTTSNIIWKDNRPDMNSASTSLTPNFASYFGSEWSKNWATAQIIDDEPPQPPDQLSVLPKSEKKTIVVMFQLPENSQRDVWKMTLYRRVIDRRGQEVVPWTKVSDFDMTRPGYYEDKDVQFSPSFPGAAPFRYIYAATSWSVHNGESKLSEQIGARLNSDWEQRGEHPVEFFSSRGVDRLADHGVFSTIPMKMYKTHIMAVPLKQMKFGVPARVVISGQQRLGTRHMLGWKYILRVHSLDTGETIDLDFQTGVLTLPSHILHAPSNIYVPSANEQYVYDDRALTSG